MASYLQGVQDYIPQIQPFQPDLNLYASVLQTKQTQYDTAWKSLNNIYGQYFYSDLTRESNIERKEEILKNIDFNLKRVSGLDLSLDQNVQQAVQVFKPFYQDQYLMKDMAWTKNYSNQRGMAEGYKNSYDEERRSRYWDTGVRALDYMREEFKNTSDDESLSFSNVSYTPYVNVQKQAMKLAKEANLSIETVKFSDDPNKSWIIKTKNGQQLEEPLSKLFEATLGSDPAIQQVYQTQAYVNRKDYAYSNAAQFNGDVNAAEMRYLEDSYNILKQENIKRYNELRVISQTYDNQIAAMEKAIKSGNAKPEAEFYLEQLKENKSINEQILSRADKQIENFTDESRTGETSTGFQNPYGDLKSLRYKVDNGMASMLMQKDLNEAAEYFAYTNAKQDIEANPYAVNEQKFRQSMAIADKRGQYMLKAVALRNAGELDKYALESGTAYRDPKTGQVIPIESMNFTYLDASNKGKGDAMGITNMKSVSESMMQQRTNEYVLPWANKMVGSLEELKSQGLISDSDINYILNGNTKRNYNLKTFNDKVRSSPNLLFRKELSSNSIKEINNRLNGVFRRKSQIPEIQDALNFINKDSEKLKQYIGLLDADNDYRIKQVKNIENHFAKSNDETLKIGGKFLYDNKAIKRSKDAFYDVLLKGNILSPEDLKAFQGYLMEKKQKEAWEKGDEAVFKAVGQIFPTSNWIGPARKVASKLSSLAPQEKYSQYDPKRNPRVKKILERYDYDKIVVAASKAWSDRNVISEPPPGIGKYGDQGEYNPGTGMYIPGITAIDVSSKGFGTKGNVFFQEFIHDHRNLDYNDPTKVAVSFDGATKSAFDAAKDSDINSIGRALIDQIITESRNAKSDPMFFTLGAQKIAANKGNTSAMIFKPDYDMIKKYIGALDKNGKPTNLLTQEQANKILQNGVTIMAPANLFKNGLMKGSTMSPIEALVDYNGSYTLDGPSGYSSFTIKKNQYGTGDYSTELSYKLWDINQKKFTSDITYNNFAVGNVDALVEQMYENDKILLEYNKQAANGGR